MRCWPIHELLNKATEIFKIHSGEFCFLTPESCTDALRAMLQKADFNTPAGFLGDNIEFSNNDGEADGSEGWGGIHGARGG